MNDNQCQKMTGEEIPISRVSTWSHRGEIGLYDQARKALIERSPFDSEQVNISRVTTLPAALADSLSKYANTSRKRQKKSSDAHTHTHTHSHSHSQVRGSNIWVDTEDYFRLLTLEDIDALSHNSPLPTHSYFIIPPVKHNLPSSLATATTTTTTSAAATTTTSASPVQQPHQGGSHLQPSPAVKDQNEQQPMEIDGAEANITNLLLSKQSDPSHFPSIQPDPSYFPSIQPEPHHSFASMPTSPPRFSVFEWLLGSRNKILLTSERPSKKRKLLGSDAGLDRLRLVCPSQRLGSPVCHVCCLGDLAEHSNRLLLCNSCKVTVHQKCYGVQEFPVGLWLCSWCKYCRETGTELFTTPCFLCPKAGGALKPLVKDTAERKPTISVRFVHLFCSQWMPEVYVEDTNIMEPVMNVGAIKETRKKLVCNICKVKYGACVRCSHGTCRTSFHPICAREARNRMEIWGKTGIETVELRAFCSKHSEFQDNSALQTNVHPSVLVGCDPPVSKNMPVKFLVNQSHKLKLGRKNGDQSMVLFPTSDTISNKSGNSEVSSEQDTSVPISNTRSESECHDAQSSVSMDTPDGINQEKVTDGISNGRTNQSDSLDFIQVLKKLVDQGKVNLKDVALEMGISTDSLAAALVGDRSSFPPNLHEKIAVWLDDHPDIGHSHRGSNITVSCMAGVPGGNGPAVAVESGSNSKVAPIKTIPPRKSISNRRIIKDNKVICSLNRMDVQVKGSATGMGVDNVNSMVPNGEEESDNDKRSPCLKDDKEMFSSEPLGNEDLGSSIEQSVRPEGDLANCNSSENGRANAVDGSVPVGIINSNGEHPVSSAEVVTPLIPNPLGAKSVSCSYVHPFIQKRLMHLQKVGLVNQENINLNTNGLSERDASNINGLHSPCIDPDHTSSASKLEHLVEAKKMGILDLSPEDEVEGELIYYQNKLIENAVTCRHYYDDLIFRVIKALPQELEAERKRRWDSVLVNQYISGVREAKKQGRKERRHKEAQAVLAAATAAAAASSRISSFRKDSHDEVTLQEAAAVGGRTAPYSQPLPRAKETLSRLATSRVSSEKPSHIFQLKSFLSEHQQICDICRRSETMLNPIYVCCHCKVAVHFGCYRGVRDHTGPWYCELCEELLPFRSPTSLPTHSREKSATAVQCGLCGCTTGAFRKSTDGQWVHSFCAEWLLEATFIRGQPNPVEGMETIMKGREFCCICSRKVGLCIKCNYGNCQSIFHPICARNAGFYMHVKTVGGRLLHKAYCDKHSLEQRRKAEAQQHGPEELKAVKQIRVELERVRLLCERIIKREKVKRELVICSHNILASKRDSVAFSVLVRSPFFLPDISSESATTSLRGHVDDNKSCSEAMQRSEDITADSAASGKRRDLLPVAMDIDQKTDDSSTSQHLDIRSPLNRPLFSGKQLPHRPALISRSSTDDEDRRLKSKKHTETFQKELVMTSDQASVQNQRLPKGFAYVPIVCLPKEKPAVCERDSPESVEPDG